MKDKKEHNKVVVSVSIDKGLYNRLKKILDKHDVKFSTIVNNALKNSIDKIEDMYDKFLKIKEESQ